MKKNAGLDCNIFKALGDRTRYKIVAALLDGERCACEIPKIVKRAQPTVSLQLKRLSKAGIVSARRDGKNMIYKIANRHERALVPVKLKRPALWHIFSYHIYHLHIIQFF